MSFSNSHTRWRWQRRLTKAAPITAALVAAIVLGLAVSTL